MPDPIGQNRFDTEARRKVELEKQKAYLEQLKRDRTTLLARPDFQRVMADIIGKGGMFQSVMTGNSMTYHKSGRQDFAREIWMDMAEADLDKAHDLLKPKKEDDL